MEPPRRGRLAAPEGSRCPLVLIHLDYFFAGTNSVDISPRMTLLSILFIKDIVLQADIFVSPAKNRWVFDDGLVTLLGHIAAHLFREAWWRETGEWLGPEVGHSSIKSVPAEQDGVRK